MYDLEKRKDLKRMYISKFILQMFLCLNVGNTLTKPFLNYDISE